MKKILISLALIAGILSNASAMGDRERNALAIIGGVAVVGAIVNANQPRYEERYESYPPRYVEPQREVIVVDRPVRVIRYEERYSYPSYYRYR